MKPALLVLAAGLMGAIGGGVALVADHAASSRYERAIEEAYLITVAADLRRDREALAATATRLDEQIGLADFLLGLDGSPAGGRSAARMEALSEVAGLEPLAVVSDSYDDLVFTGRAATVADPRLRETMVAYYRLAARAASSGEEGVAAYVAWMEGHLDEGPWRYWRGEDVVGEYPLDFRVLLAELREGGVEVGLRAARRGLEERRAAVAELREANADLLARIDAARGGDGE